MRINQISGHWFVNDSLLVFIIKDCLHFEFVLDSELLGIIHLITLNLLQNKLKLIKNINHC